MADTTKGFDKQFWLDVGDVSALPKTNTAEKSPLRGDRAYYVEAARQAAIRHGIPEGVFIAQINQESGFNPKAGSYAGAQGIAQIVPKYHPAMAGKTYDPIKSLDYAASLMRKNLNKYGDMRLALAAYNGGDGAAQYLRRNPRFLDTPDMRAHRDSWRNQSADYQKKILTAAGAVGGIANNYKTPVRSIAQTVVDNIEPAPVYVPTATPTAAIAPVEAYGAVAGIMPTAQTPMATPPRTAMIQYNDAAQPIAGIYTPLKFKQLGSYE